MWNLTPLIIVVGLCARIPALCVASWLAGCLLAFLLLFRHSFNVLTYFFICCGLLVKVLLSDTQGEDSPDQESWKKLDFIPKEYMGHVIGKRRENLDKIEQKTGVTLKVWERNGLCIKGPPESQKRAIREIKEQVVSLAMKVIRTAG